MTNSGETSQSEKILSIIEQDCEFVLSSSGEKFATIVENHDRPTYPLPSENLKNWIAGRTYDLHGFLPDDKILEKALGVFALKNMKNPLKAPVFYRVGKIEGTYFLDLGLGGKIVKISPEDWIVSSSVDARFFQREGTLPLPIPVKGGDARDLEQHINFATRRDGLLTIAFCLGALTHRTSYPILVIRGEQGAAKSTTSRMLKRLIDPSRPELRSFPKSEEDIFIGARSSHLLSFDNLSGLPAWASDAICKLATGCGFAGRILYTNDSERVIELARPVLLNGIEDLLGRPDLADRAIMLHLNRIDESNRKGESEVWQRFEEALPRLLGGFLDLIVHGLRVAPTLRLKKLPRMADFGTFIAAALTLYGYDPDEVIAELSANKSEMAIDAVEMNAVARSINAWMDSTGREWRGTASELMRIIERQNGQDGYDKDWPRSVAQFSMQISRISPVLREVGIIVERHKSGSERLLTIQKVEKIRKEPSQPSQSSLSKDSRDSKDDGFHSSRNKDQGVET